MHCTGAASCVGEVGKSGSLILNCPGCGGDLLEPFHYCLLETGLNDLIAIVVVLNSGINACIHSGWNIPVTPGLLWRILDSTASREPILF